MASVIIDFDGTIANSLPLALDLFYKWSGRKPFTESEIQHFRDMHLREILTEIKIPLWKVARLLVSHRAEFGRRMDEVPAFAGVADTVKQLHKSGHKLHIMSTNSTQNIRKFIKTQQLDDIFDSVNGNVGIFGKTGALRLVLKRYKIAKDECYCIGDEVRDIEAARRVGLKSAAVTWGYNSEKILKEHEPDFVVHKPHELVELIQ